MVVSFKTTLTKSICDELFWRGTSWEAKLCFISNMVFVSDCSHRRDFYSVDLESNFLYYVFKVNDL